MNPLADDLIVALLLALSVGYAVMKLGPRSLRQNIQAVTADALNKAPALLGLGGLAQRLTERSLGKSKGACGGCDSCGADSPPPELPSDRPKEISVPIAKIGRRVESPMER